MDIENFIKQIRERGNYDHGKKTVTIGGSIIREQDFDSVDLAILAGKKRSVKVS